MLPKAHRTPPHPTPISLTHSINTCTLDWKKLNNNAFCPHSCVSLFVPRVSFILGIKHGFSCINVRQVPWEVLKTEAGGHGFQHLPRDLANVNALKNHVRSLLLHKYWKHLLHFVLFLALFCFAISPMSHERNCHGLCSF